MHALLAMVLAATLQRFPAFVSSAFATAPDKTLYSAGTYGGVKGIFRITADGPVKVADVPADLPVVWMTASADGSFLVTGGTGIYRATAGGVTKIEPGYVTNLTAATDGAVWGLQHSSGALRFAPDGGLSIVLQNWPVYALAPGRDGTMWLASIGSLAHVSASGALLSQTNLFLGILPRVAPAPDGGVWVSQWWDRSITRVDPRGEATAIALPLREQAAGFAATADALYVTTAYGDLLRYRDGEWSLAKFGGPPAPYSACDTFYERALAIDVSGRLWAAESLPVHVYIPFVPVCEYDAPADVRYSLLRVDDSAFLPLGNRKRAAGR